MRVAHLSLADFRNYRSAELDLRPGPNLLVGRNGQGKTNLVEAIGYFSTLRSHRVTGDAALIRAGAQRAIVRMKAAVGDRDVLLEIELPREGRSRARVNRNDVQPRELTRWFASVAFAPEDLGIVRGEPGVRRRFLDDALTLRHPVAGGTLGDYDRVLRQRTALLKSARASGAKRIDDTLAIWDDQLIEFGTQIMLARRGLVDRLRDPLRRGYETLVGEDHGPQLQLSESVISNASGLEAPNVSRETGEVDDRDARRTDVSRETLMAQFTDALANVRARELERGVTLVGPHRDDLLLSLNDLPVKGYASHGESWSYALSLKLALATTLREESPGGDPVIILDDVFAELDTGRRSRLMSAVLDFEQVIVTAPVAEDVPDSVPWHRIGIEAGRIVEAEE